MSILCLWNPIWQTGEGSAAELMPLLLEEAPRVAMEERGVVWVDVRGLPGESIARLLLTRLARKNIVDVRAGIASRPIVAEGAARYGDGDLTLAPEGGERSSFTPYPVTLVPEGSERSSLAPCPLTLLTTDEHLLTMLDGVGVRTCGELANLSAEAAEVRFGPEGIRLWLLARGDDRRLLFRPIPPERPHASVDFLDYTVHDATRLVFTLNALLDQVCATLRDRARRARTMTLTFTLAGGGHAQEILRTGRPTADRTLWMRRLRVALEGIKLDDSIAGVALEAGTLESISALQGDLFDRGFATATFVEEAVARLLDLYRGIFTRQTSSRHPLAERRTRWVDLTPEEAIDPASTGHSELSDATRHSGRSEAPGLSKQSEAPGLSERSEAPGLSERSEATGHSKQSEATGLSERSEAESRNLHFAPGATFSDSVREAPVGEGRQVATLQLQLLPQPQPIRVRSRTRRDHVLPISYMEGNGWHDLQAAGPDRISGGHEEKRSYAREYYRCVSDTGSLIWIYRDAVENRWFLHGWWD